VWIFAWNPAMAKMYAVAVSQVLVASMMTWALVFTLGKDRSQWQIVLGSFMAGLVIMTRINMLPLLPLLVLYTFWQHGGKAGISATITGSLTLLVGHAIYWPGILQMWTRLPRSISPFLDAWRVPKEYLRSWKPEIPATGRILSFLHTIRFHFAAMAGALFAWLLWQRRDKWDKLENFRAVVFLSTLFIALLIAHMWAALGKDYCVFCLAGYVTFFSVLGVLVAAISFASWRKDIPVWGQVLIVLVLLVLSTGLGFSAFEDIGTQLIEIGFPGALVGSSKSGSVTLGEILINKFGTDRQTLKRLLPAVFGLALGLLVLLIALVIKYLNHRNRIETDLPSEQFNKAPAFAYLAVIIFFVGGILLSPTPVFAGGYSSYDCSGDVIDTYKEAGEHLAENIPPGSSVYWKGGLSVVPLLYVPDIQIYTAQINGGYSLFDIGDPDTLVKFGYWNRDLAEQWAYEADYVLIEERSYKGWLRDIVTAGGYQELESTPPVVVCRDDAHIHIFKKTP
jgi:hypothetical protein